MKKAGKTATISVRTNVDLKRRLEAIAAKQDRSLSWVCEKALITYAAAEEDTERSPKMR